MSNLPDGVRDCDVDGEFCACGRELRECDCNGRCQKCQEKRDEDQASEEQDGERWDGQE